MAISLATATRNAMADAAVDLIDVGAGTNGSLVVYSGTPPATADTALSGNTALATFTLADPAFGAAASGVATLDATPTLTTTGDAAGTATFFRIYDQDGANLTDVVLQGAVATSGAELNLNTTTISVGVNVEITSGTFTMPAS